jgi:hypothetical protein
MMMLVLKPNPTKGIDEKPPKIIKMKNIAA